MRGWSSWVLVLAVGCTRNNPNAGVAAPPDLSTVVDFAVAGPDQAVALDAAGSGAVDLSSGRPDGPIPPDLLGIDFAVLMCTPDEFIVCDGNLALYCAPGGVGTDSFDCGAGGCFGPDGCGQCSGDGCSGGALFTCDLEHGMAVAGAACVTLGNQGSQCANGTTCAQCTGARVCGDGVHFGTVVDSSYLCTGGVVGAGTACPFGCNAASGDCAQFVPASQATQHLAANDTFTCGAVAVKRGALVIGAGEAVLIDTTAASFKMLSPSPTPSPLPMGTWGGSYTPSGGGTKVRVAHIGSLTMTGNARLQIAGGSGLVLLVDGDVSISGTAVIDASGRSFGAISASSFSGPGAPTSVLSAPGQAGIATGGAGGAGHNGHGGTGGSGAAGMAGAPGSGYGATTLEAGATGGRDYGGHGGGALQISACGNFSLGAGTLLNASGGGARGSDTGGGGGGSAGTLWLEAQTFNVLGGGNASLAGELVCNGGGGGGGAAASADTSGKDWDPATTPATQAPGGGGGNGGTPGGQGGSGGAVNAPGNGGSTDTIGGGGGGAAGRIFCNRSPIAPLPALTSSGNVSPGVVFGAVTTR